MLLSSILWILCRIQFAKDLWVLPIPESYTSYGNYCAMESFEVVPPWLSPEWHYELIASEKNRHNSTIVFFVVVDFLI